MPQPRKISPGFRGSSSALALRQFGLATRKQLVRRDVSTSSIDRSLAAGRLFEVHPGVYSVVPPPLLSADALHAAAILKGGEDARLFGLSTAWWAGLRAQRPPLIHVGILGRRAEVGGIRWHRVTSAEHVRHRRLPITPLPRLPLECAADLASREIKHLLAELEYHHGVGPGDVVTRRGLNGSGRLSEAIAAHLPQLAETRSHLERAFLYFLADRGLALPVVNHPVGLSTIDAVFEDQRLIVELDGVKGHRGDRRVLRDHRRDLHRRREGFSVLRYAYAQLLEDGDLVEDELRRHGVPSRR